MQNVDDLWQQHLTARFPAECRSLEAAGFEWPVLDADTAGCISAYVCQGRQLDPWRLGVLGLCYRHLAVAITSLDGEAREYSARIEALAGLVLSEIAERECPV